LHHNVQIKMAVTVVNDRQNAGPIRGGVGVASGNLSTL
jgi:hypothetical protein